MIGLRSQFGPSLLLVAVVVVVAVVVAVIAARRASAAGGSPLGVAARALAVGAVVATILATALPRRLAIETDGDLVLRLGRGGLGDWRILFDDPTSLASIELVSNVLLYAAIGFTMTLGWFRQRRFVLPVSLALSILIEAAQYGVLGRVAALDDVLLNGAGAVVGYLAAIAFTRSVAGSRPSVELGDNRATRQRETGGEDRNRRERRIQSARRRTPESPVITGSGKTRWVAFTRPRRRVQSR